MYTRLRNNENGSIQDLPHFLGKEWRGKGRSISIPPFEKGGQGGIKEVFENLTRVLEKDL